MSEAKQAYNLGCINTLELFTDNAYWQGVLATDKTTWTWLYKHLPIGKETGGPWMTLAGISELVRSKVLLTKKSWCETQGEKSKPSLKKYLKLQHYCAKLPNSNQAVTAPGDYSLPVNWQN